MLYFVEIVLDMLIIMELYIIGECLMNCIMVGMMVSWCLICMIVMIGYLEINIMLKKIINIILDV